MKKSLFLLINAATLFCLVGCSKGISSSSFFSSSSTGLDSSFSSTSSSSSFVSSSSTYRTDLLPYEESTYRLSLNALNTSSQEAPLYNVNSAHEIDCSALAEVYRGHDYIEPYEVASYFQSFGELPPNYSTDRPTVISYPNKMGRLISIYNFSSGGYGGGIGPAKKGGTYYELDIGTPTTNSSYIYRTSIVRGAYRLVVLPRDISYQYEKSDGSYDSVIYYTENHYSSFVEYCNYANAWSEDFNGEGDVFGERASLTSLSQDVCSA